MNSFYQLIESGLATFVSGAIIVAFLAFVGGLRAEGRLPWAERHPFLTALAVIVTVPLSIELLIRFVDPAFAGAGWTRQVLDVCPALLLNIVLT